MLSKNPRLVLFDDPQHPSTSVALRQSRFHGKGPLAPGLKGLSLKCQRRSSASPRNQTGMSDEHKRSSDGSNSAIGDKSYTATRLCVHLQGQQARCAQTETAVVSSRCWELQFMLATTRRIRAAFRQLPGHEQELGRSETRLAVSCARFHKRGPQFLAAPFDKTNFVWDDGCAGPSRPDSVQTCVKTVLCEATCTPQLDSVGLRVCKVQKPRLWTMSRATKACACSFARGRRSLIRL